MADRSEALADLDLTTVDTFDPGSFAIAEKLSHEEQILVDKLSQTVMNFIEGMRLSKPIAKAVARRLLEKLRQANLPGDSVGPIAEGVWRRLNGVGHGTNALLEDCCLAELRIVEDVMHKVDGPMSILISGLKREVLASVDPSTNGKIIRAVARKTWPQVRLKLGV